MNVSFKNGHQLENGYSITNKNGLSEFVAENEDYVVCFRSDAGEGRNYFNVQWVTYKSSNRRYWSPRFTRKFIPEVREWSCELLEMYREKNQIKETE